MRNRTRWVIGAAAGTALIAGGTGAAIAAGDGDEASRPRAALTGDAFDRASGAALAYLGGGRITEMEVGDEEGFYEVEVVLEDGQEVDVHLDEDFTVLGEERETEDQDEARDEDEGAEDDAGEQAEQVTGPDWEDAAAAALAEVGDGRVTEIEAADDGDRGYEVEVRRGDGSSVEVDLDQSFGVVSVEDDD